MGTIEYKIISLQGLVTTSAAEAAGVPRARLSEAASSGELERVARGVYCLPDELEDQFVVASVRFPKGILSHATALYLRSLTNVAPLQLEMTFPRTYNASSARKEGLSVRTCNHDLMALGLSVATTPQNHEVRCYDAERTLCDMFRGVAHVDTQLVNPAMRTYVASKTSDIDKLMEYAKVLGVERKMSNYLEVLF